MFTKNNRFLWLCCLFLLAFIPLFPKVPLTDLIPGYLVKLRLEDIFIFATAAVWLISLRHDKRILGQPWLWWAGAFGVAGGISLFLAVSLTQTVPFQLLHIGKSGLHLFRYGEYFLLYLLFYSGLTKLSSLTTVRRFLIAIVWIVAFYGIGQRYWSFPVFSTMNREFSKGQALQLSADARVPSTFAGHYDLSAFLVIVLPILAAWTLLNKNKHQRLFLITTQCVGIGLLWIGASKTSLTSYSLSLAVVFFWWWRRWEAKKALKKKLLWLGITISAIAISSLLLVMRQPIENRVKIIMAPPDTSHKEISPNGIKYGLSMGIRLDTLWPQAVAGWVRNPVTGSGFATLNKELSSQFTEAESTDNNYLRTLGETGSLGFLFFYGTIAVALWQAYRLAHSENQEAALFGLGLLAGGVGLLLNAVYIDVFVASKVALFFWALHGLGGKTWQLSEPREYSKYQQHFFLRLHTMTRLWPVFLVGFWWFITAYRHPFYDFGAIQSLHPAPHLAQNLLTAKCMLGQLPDDLCQTPQVSLANGIYVWYLLPWLFFFPNPGIFVMANLVLLIITFVLLCKSLMRLTNSPHLTAMLLFFLSLTRIVTTWPSLPSSSSLLTSLLIFGLWQLSLQVKFAFPKLPNHFNVVFTMVCLVIASFLLSGGVQVRSFALHDRFWRYHAVRRLNETLTKLNNPFSDKPLVIGLVDKSYVELFQVATYSYQTLPNDLTLLSKPLESRQIFYATSEGSPLHIQAILKDFSLSVIEMDCFWSCNIYQLQPKKMISQLKATLYDGRSALLGTTNNDYTISLLGHSFSPSSAEPYQTLDFLKKLELQANHLNQATAIVMIGDLVNKQDGDQKSLLQSALSKLLTVPVLYAPANRQVVADKAYDRTFQSFTVGNDLYLMLDLNKEGEISDHQKKFLVDTLFMAQQSPNIEHIILISPDLSWEKQFTQQPRTDSPATNQEAFMFYLAQYVFATTEKPLIVLQGGSASQAPRSVMSKVEVAQLPSITPELEQLTIRREGSNLNFEWGNHPEWKLSL